MQNRLYISHYFDIFFKADRSAAEIDRLNGFLHRLLTREEIVRTLPTVFAAPAPYISLHLSRCGVPTIPCLLPYNAGPGLVEAETPAVAFFFVFLWGTPIF